MGRDTSMPSNKNRRPYTPPFVATAPPRFPSPTAGLAWEKKDQLLFWPDAGAMGETAPLFEVRPSLPWTGSRRLLLGVLQDALRSFFQHRSSSTTAGRRRFAEIREWIWSPEQDWIYSFESICAHLRLDPGYLRQGLQSFLQPTRPLNAAHRGSRVTLGSPVSRRPFHLFAGPGIRAPSQKLRRSAQRRTVATIKA